MCVCGKDMCVESSQRTVDFLRDFFEMLGFGIESVKFMALYFFPFIDTKNI